MLTILNILVRPVYFLLIIAIGVPSVSVAEGDRSIRMGISITIPPWVIKESDSGIELDILKAALTSKGYTISPAYMPFARVKRMYDAKKLDGVINAKPGVYAHGYLSDPVVTFQNVAISLKEKNYPEDITIDFLRDKSVVAFQNATKFLGESFSTMSKNNDRYQELANQSLQINLLFVRKIDFIVMDKSIFGYYWQQAVKNKKRLKIASAFQQEIRFHSIFQPNPYSFIFADKQIRDDFNEGLKLIKERGEYDDIINRYDHLTNLYSRQNK